MSGARQASSWQPADWASARLPQVPRPPEGGLVDANSYIGVWPTRRIDGDGAPDVQAQVQRRLELMDALDIRRAAVSHLDGVWLKDSGQSNRELHRLLGGSLRFFPVYTLNPIFPAWQEHLARCEGDLGLARGTGAIRLYPTYHGYRLADAAARPALEALAARDLPVVLPIQLEDARMHHPAMRVPDVPAADLAAAAGQVRGLRWIVVAAVATQIQAIAAALPGETHVWFDVSRVQGPIDGIRILRQRVGAARLVFGTNLPLTLAESPIMELADARLEPADDAALRFGNARAALGI